MIKAISIMDVIIRLIQSLNKSSVGSEKDPRLHLVGFLFVPEKMEQKEPSDLSEFLRR